VISAATTITGQTNVGYTNDYASGTNCVGTDGRDRVYEVSVAAGRQLVATVHPTTATFDPSINIVAGPASACAVTPRACLSGTDPGSAGADDTVTISNNGTSAVNYFIVVDSYTMGTAGTGSFDLVIAYNPAPMGDRCSSATALTAGTALAGQTTVGFSNDYQGGTGCSTATTSQGPDRAYSINVGAGQRLTVNVTPAATLNTTLSLVGGTAAACDATPRVCVANGNVDTSGSVDTVVYTNTGAAQDVFVVVDSSQLAGGTFSILATLDTPPASGDICQAPDTLTAGSVIASTTVGFSNNYSGSGTGCTSASAGPDRVFALSVPSNTRATVTSTADAGFDPSLALVNSPAANCDSRTCLSFNNTGGSGGIDTLVLSNKTAAAQTVFVIVDSSAVAGGLFSIGAVFGAIPVNDVCATASAPITASIVLPTETTAGFTNDYGSGTNCSATAGPDRVYAVTVPAGQRLTATMTPAAGATADLGVNLVTAAACEVTPRVCLAGDNSGALAAVNSASYFNSTAASQSIFVIIGTSTSSTATSAYSLAIDIAAPPAGDTCASATPVTTLPATLANQTMTGFGNDYGAGTSCTGTSGVDRVYSVSIPAGQRLTALVHPLSAWNPSINLVSTAACSVSPIACLAGSDTAGTSLDETLNYDNAGASAVTVNVIIDSASVTVTGAFDLTLSVAPIPPPPVGDLCNNAVAITASATLTAQSTTGYANNYAPATTCTGYGTAGLDRVYTVTLAPTKSVTATVARVGTVGDPSIYLVQGPASQCIAIPVCLAGDDSGTGATVNMVTYTNATAAPMEVFIVIDTIATGGALPDYTLTVTLP